MEIRLLERRELPDLWSIDRAEVIFIGGARLEFEGPIAVDQRLRLREDGQLEVLSAP